jgi:hypothetical protein
VNRSLVALLISLVAAGCTQSTLFRSDPPGARISVNGQFVGITPAHYEMAEWDVPRVIHYRVERGAYLPQEGELRAQFSVGRLVGAIFTVGLLYAARGPYVYKEAYDFALAPVGDSRDVEKEPLRIDERLRRLQDLFNQGLISEQEYQQQRAAILHGL